MTYRRLWIGAVAAGAVGLALGTVWLATPSTAPEAPEARPAPPRAARRPAALLPAGGPSVAALDGARPGGRGKAKAGRKGAKAAREPAGRPDRDPELEPDDRAALRDEVREERLASLADRLDSYATEAGWDEETTARVEQILTTTTDKITRNLTRVDQGEVAWEEVRTELRDYRIDQAKRVRNVLGDEEFDRFAEGMDLTRFMGDRPIRGRLD